MSRILARGSFVRLRRRSSRTFGASPRGSKSQSGSLLTIAERVSVTVSPSKTLFAGERLEQTAAKRPIIRPLVDGFSPRLLGAHVGRGAHDGAESGAFG